MVLVAHARNPQRLRIPAITCDRNMIRLRFRLKELLSVASNSAITDDFCFRLISLQVTYFSCLTAGKVAIIGRMTAGRNCYRPPPHRKPPERGPAPGRQRGLVHSLRVVETDCIRSVIFARDAVMRFHRARSQVRFRFACGDPMPSGLKGYARISVSGPAVSMSFSSRSGSPNFSRLSPTACNSDR